MHILAAMHEVSHSLSNIVSSIRESADEICIASSEIANGNLDLSNRTESLASSLVQAVSVLKVSESDSQPANHPQAQLSLPTAYS